MQSGYFVALHTPLSGSAYVGGSKLIVTGIAAYFDASVPIFRSAKRVLLQLLNETGAIVFQADSEVNQINFNRALQFFATQTTLPRITDGTPRRFVMRLTATWDVQGGGSHDFIREAPIDVLPEGSTASTWAPPAPPAGDLTLALNRPAPNEPVNAGFQFLVQGHSNFVDDDSFLFISLIDDVRRYIVDDALITAWFRIDGNVFRAAMTAPSLAPGPIANHSILVQAIHKTRSTLTASKTFPIGVRVSAPTLSRVAGMTGAASGDALPPPPTVAELANPTPPLTPTPKKVAAKSAAKKGTSKK